MTVPQRVDVVFRRRAERLIPKVRNRLGDNSWLVNIFVLGLFIVMILS